MKATSIVFFRTTRGTPKMAEEAEYNELKIISIPGRTMEKDPTKDVFLECCINVVDSKEEPATGTFRQQAQKQ